MKLGENFVVPPAGSPDFDALANTVTSGFKKTLTKLPEFYKISVDEFSQYVYYNIVIQRKARLRRSFVLVPRRGS